MNVIQLLQNLNCPSEENFIDNNKVDRNYVMSRDFTTLPHLYYMKYGNISSYCDMWIPEEQLSDFINYLVDKKYKILHVQSNFSRFPSHTVIFHNNGILLSIEGAKFNTSDSDDDILPSSELDDDDNKILSVDIQYSTEKISEILEIQEKFGAKFNMVQKNKILLFEKNEYNEIVLNAHKLKSFDLDVKEYYNDDFYEVHEKTVKWMNDFSVSNNRLILFHGVPGAGKTNYIKHLMGLPSKVKKIYLSPSFIQLMADPSFIPVLRREKKSILIIEDAEKILSRREDTADNSIISTLLNMCDGIMADVLDFKIIATFNIDEDKIDDALKRQGRMFLKYKFEPLTEEKTRHLYNKVHGKDPTSKRMTLAEIYNEKNDFGKKEEERRMGFNI